MNVPKKPDAREPKTAEESARTEAERIRNEFKASLELVKQALAELNKQAPEKVAQ